MSNIIIPDISAEARRRLGRTAAVAVRTRRDQARPLDRYNPLRDPWTHAFYPGLDHRLGKLAPRDAAIAEAIEEFIKPEHQADAAALFACPLPLSGEGPLEYNRRITSPEMGLTLAQQRRCANAFLTARTAGVGRGTAAQRATAAEEPLYRILDTGGVVSLTPRIERAAPAVNQTFTQVAEIPGPSMLRAIHIDTTVNNGAGSPARVTIPALGFSYLDGVEIIGGGFPGASTDLPLGILIRDPATLEVSVDLVDTGGGYAFTGNIQVAYNHVTGLRPRPRPEPGAEPYEGPVSPYIQLDPSIAGAFDQAGIPDEWYIVRD